MAVLMNFRKESTCTKQNQSKKFYKLVCIMFLSYDIFACLLLKLNHAEFGEIFDVSIRMLCKILIIPQMAGFHLSASVIPPQGLQQAKGNFNVAVVFDRRRISSCTCTCNSQPSWCSHVVALCLYRIHQVRTAIVNRWTYIMSSIGNCCMLCI